jgi:hypothetical protein
MSDWILVPSLVALRTEFNLVAPRRDKGADGSIGDSGHASSSDHTPDEDSDILRDHDADSKNEVHALDIDSTGPWPGGAAWFDRKIREIVAREKAEYLSPTMVGRLKYVIWDRTIWARSAGWQAREYVGTDPHTNHAHFSSRYESGPESDTRPWGVADERIADMELDDLLWEKGKEPESWTKRFPGSAPTVRNALALSAYDFKDGANNTDALRNELSAARADISVLRSAIEALSQGGDPAPSGDPEAFADRVADKLANRLQS